MQATSISCLFIRKTKAPALKALKLFRVVTEQLEVVSDLILIGEGQNVNGVDNGNLALIKDKSLTEGKTYVFEIEAPAGLVGCKLTITEK